MKKFSVYDFLLLKALFNESLHNAIMNCDIKAISNYIDNYNNYDKQFYNFYIDWSVDLLKLEHVNQLKEIENACKMGVQLFGM